MIKRWVIAAAAMLALTACSEAYVDYEPEWMAMGTKPDVVLEASILLQDKALAIQYTLRNKGSEPVVAYVKVPGDAASHAWDVYVTAHEDGTVEIAKRTFAIPPNVHVDAIGTIDGVVIEPGGQFQERFQISLPLKGRRPYMSEVKLPDPVKQVIFCVGVVLQAEVKTPYALNGPQHLFCTQPMVIDGTG